MATIGTFTSSGDSFTGTLKTLSINAKTTIKPADKASDKAPDYRIFAGQRRVRRRLEEDLRRGPRLPLGQARRPELPRPDLRHPGRGRGGRQLQPDLVPPQRRLTHGGAPRSTRSGASSRTGLISSGSPAPAPRRACMGGRARGKGRKRLCWSFQHTGGRGRPASTPRCARRQGGSGLPTAPGQGRPAARRHASPSPAARPRSRARLRC